MGTGTKKPNAAAKTKSVNLNKTSGVKALNMTAGPTKAAALALLCGFENFLFFCLHFAEAFMMVLQPRNNKNKSLKPDIVIKMRQRNEKMIVENKKKTELYATTISVQHLNFSIPDY